METNRLQTPFDSTLGTAIPAIKYSFVPDLANPITIDELAYILKDLLQGLTITVSEEFIGNLPTPMRRHFASTQLQTSPLVT